MNKEQMAEQLKVRKEELRELEDLVQKYANTIRNVSPLLKGNMIVAYRMGLVECMHWLDQKAQEKAIQRSIRDSMIGE